RFGERWEAAKRAAAALATDAPPAPSPNGRGDPARRPAIDAGDKDLERGAAKAWAALELANDPPRLFRFGRVPVRVEGGGDGEDPIAQPLDEHRLRHHLARAAIWYTMTEDGQVRPAAPRLDVVRDMLASPDCPLPPLLAIVQTPTFAPDGTLQT